MLDPPSLLRWMVTPPIVSVQVVSGDVPSSEEEELEDVLEARVRGGEARKEGRFRR